MFKQFIFIQIVLQPVISKQRLEMISTLKVLAISPARVTESLQKSLCNQVV